MGALAGLVNSTIDSVTGANSGTNLQSFLQKFSSSEGKWINTLDPLNSFDVYFAFYPTKDPDDSSNGLLEKLGNAALNNVKGAVKNLANNLTGGLLGSFMNSIDIEGNRNSFDKKGVHTFLEYLAAANLLVGEDDWIGENAGKTISPLTLNLGPYTQKIIVPSLKIPDGGKSTTQFGDFPINGTFVIPDNNTLTFDILNGKVPLHERIFYPWMREVTLPYWSYESQPYTTATITIDFTKHCDIKYVFCGCRPTQIFTQQPNQQQNGENIMRQVIFTFDYMFVTSSLSTTESVANKLLSTGKTLLNGGMSMMNM